MREHNFHPWPDVSPSDVSPSAVYKVVPADAIVIERGDLPEMRDVDPSKNTVNFEGITYHIDPTYAYDEALRWVAIVEYLRANPPADPPVDEEQVAEVTKALYAATSDPYDIDVPDVARRLVQAGVRVVTTP